MLTPARLLTIDGTAYPSASATTRDVYNNPVEAVGEGVPVKLWCHQGSTAESTVDTHQASEAWTVYLMPAPGEDGTLDWDALASFDHASHVEVPSLQLLLQCNGTPRRWVHPPTGQLSYLEVETLTADDGWTS